MNSTRTFCPLILYHDNISKDLSLKLSENQPEYRSAIDRHRDKTNEMLELNSRYWMEQANDYSNNDIKVSPSTSTTSNISSSSSSSGDSIATLEHAYPVKAPMIEHHYYEEKAKKQPKIKSTADATKKRRRGNLPKEVTEFLRKWLIQHKKHPYPAEKEKIDLARQTGLTVNQISNWFINARRRILQPMLESENLNAQFTGYPPDESFEKRQQRQDFFGFPSDARNDADVTMNYHPYSDEERSMFYRTRSNEQYQQLSMR